MRAGVCMCDQTPRQTKPRKKKRVTHAKEQVVMDKIVTSAQGVVAGKRGTRSTHKHGVS